ncbi:MAG: DUF2027 domain-containing protein [Dysgonamonadaceae bacterium]
MKKLEVGDTVRFLSSVGGGIVKGFQNKNIVIVEDEHGFDIPVLITDCVAVGKMNDIQLSNHEQDIPKETEKSLQSEIQIEEDEKIIETPEGEKITVCLAYLPVDEKTISTTSYECYLVNDSNYYLCFNYMNRENNSWISRHNGVIEPNTKIFIEEFNKSELNSLEKICLQFIAFKHNKPYGFKNPCSVELRIDTVKFYKLHSFKENDYFDENALVYYVIQNDVPERAMLVSAGDMESAMKEKEIEEKPRRKRIQKIEKKAIIEVDLHINQLLETTAGMNNSDILEYQLSKFRETINENLKNKNQRIVFIHGKGDGVLKSAIIKELRDKYKNCYFQDASFQEYGYGATMVTIK